MSKSRKFGQIIIVRATEKMSVVLVRTSQNEQRGGSLKLLILSERTFG